MTKLKSARNSKSKNVSVGERVAIAGSAGERRELCRSFCRERDVDRVRGLGDTCLAECGAALPCPCQPITWRCGLGPCVGAVGVAGVGILGVVEGSGNSWGFFPWTSGVILCYHHSLLSSIL